MHLLQVQLPRLIHAQPVVQLQAHLPHAHSRSLSSACQCRCQVIGPTRSAVSGATATAPVIAQAVAATCHHLQPPARPPAATCAQAASAATCTRDASSSADMAIDTSYPRLTSARAIRARVRPHALPLMQPQAHQQACPLTHALAQAAASAPTFATVSAHSKHYTSDCRVCARRCCFAMQPCL